MGSFVAKESYESYSPVTGESPILRWRGRQGQIFATGLMKAQGKKAIGSMREFKQQRLLQQAQGRQHLRADKRANRFCAIDARVGMLKQIAARGSWLVTRSDIGSPLAEDDAFTGPVS